MASRCPEVDFFIPREGAAPWIDSLVIARDCPMPDQAHALVDFMLRPDVAALNATTTRFATPNASALPLLPQALAADERIFPPPDLLEKCYPLPPLDKDLEQIVNKSWHGVQRARALRDATRTVEQK